MVGLNPAKFYGRLLPRPRIYCDVKFSDSRVDPPESVNGAFLEWASEASWKMGGTATKRKRMSGKVEGRLNKLRDMDESEEDDETPPPKKVREKLSFGKKKSEKKKRSSPAPELEKHRTPIEKMLESPGNGEASKRGRLAPRRIIPDDDTEEEAPVAKGGARRSRTEQPLPDTDDDSDDDIEGFMQRLEAEKNTPTRSIRKSTRLQASPTVSQTPDSKRRSKKSASEGGDGRRTPRRSPLPFNRKRVVEDLESESDDESQSVFL